MKNFESDFFKNKKIFFATMHHKDVIVAPLFNELLSCEILPVTGLNTDSLGTFSGEIERKGTQEETALKKIETAHQLIFEPFIMASEGSFGPHPKIPFINANIELLVLKNFEHNLIWKSWHISTQIAAEELEVTNDATAAEFSSKYINQGYAIILKVKDDSGKILSSVKGLKKSDEIKFHFEELKKKHPSQKVFIEVDLRAMNNPLRQSSIKECAIKLIEKLKVVCPQCNCPGFEVCSVIKGLPCEICKLPTKLARAEIYQCQSCNYTEERIIENIAYADAQYCDFCNP